MKYPKMQWGRMEAVINKLGGESGVDQFLSGQTEVVPVRDNQYEVVLDTAHTGIDLLEMGDYEFDEEKKKNRVIEGFNLSIWSVGPKIFNFRLINLGQDFGNEDDAHALLSIPGFRKADIEELLVFGALAKPRETKIFVVAAKAYLNGKDWCTWGIGYGDDEKKNIACPPWKDGYGDHCRFLMVQNS